ncbi:Spy/CpxP family protein refolding chaperone [Pleurocapsales cyanobacterium LEGE 06147]|nr:Spy/CpxP family protein refolding chaperone [Pleurocapsales cyanobacterium LEGE 06147]
MLLRYLPILALAAIVAPSSILVVMNANPSFLSKNDGVYKLGGRVLSQARNVLQGSEFILPYRTHPENSFRSPQMLEMSVTESAPSDSSLQVVTEKSEQFSKDSWGRKLLQELNLSQDQKQQIEQIRRQYQQAMVQGQKNLHSAQQELAKMMVGTDTTEVIRSQHQQVVQLRQELGELRFESMLAIREILTPEQRQKFAQIMQSHRENPAN